MTARRAAVAATTAALTLAGLAGCGGGGTVTQTITTDRLPTTAPPAAAAAPAVGEDRLPPPGSLPGTRPGATRTLDDAQEFVAALYQVGDPSQAAARSRLEAAGYRAGILRDELGSDPVDGIALFRTYAFGVRDEAAAQAEVAAAADEVGAASSASSVSVDVAGIPGARALRLDVDQGGTTGSVIFVTFAVGPGVYGLQGVSTRAETLPQDGIVEAALRLYARVSAAP